MSRNRKGFALVAALWIVVVLSGIGLALGRTTTDRRESVLSAVERLRAREAALAGLAHARARLDDALRTGGQSPLSRDPWQAPQRVLLDSIRVGDVWYRVRLRDAGSALQLARASEAETRRLLSALRVDFGRVDEIAQSLADWQDGDDLHRLRGAERDWYLEHGRAQLPPNRALRSLGELRHVRGVDARTYTRVLPFITLLGSGQVNINSADHAVLLSLPGVTEEVASLIVQWRRTSAGRTNLDELGVKLSLGSRAAFLAALPGLRARTTDETREVIVESEGWVEGSHRRVVAVALIARAGAEGIVTWQRIE